MTLLTRTEAAAFLRCEHDALRGFCCVADCPHWDWRDLNDRPIDRPLTQQEVADLLGLSRARVGQIERVALRKFCKALGVEVKPPASVNPYHKRYGVAVAIPWRTCRKKDKPEPREYDREQARSAALASHIGRRLNRGRKCPDCGKQMWRAGHTCPSARRAA